MRQQNEPDASGVYRFTRIDSREPPAHGKAVQRRRLREVQRFFRQPMCHPGSHTPMVDTLSSRDRPGP